MFMRNSADCSCQNQSVAAVYHHLREADAPLAMGYIPDQHWNSTFPLSKGLNLGTIFPELHKPLCGKGGGWK